MELNKKQAVGALYQRGILNWKLKPEQIEIYDQIYACPDDLFVINCARRLGKSYMLGVMCDEFCRQVPGAFVKYGAPSKKQVREIIRPTFHKVLYDCPRNLMPWYNTMDTAFFYPNGSKISIVGCDGNAIDSIRGDETHLSVFDEVGMMNEDLGYIINDVIRPQSLTVKCDHPLAKKIILASTPPRSPAHQFVKYIADAQASHNNRYAHKTIYDNSLLEHETILRYAEDSGCIVDWVNKKIIKMSTTFRRESLAEVVTEETYSIIPEFDAEARLEIVREVERPPYFDCYVGMDVGMVDFTAILFGYWHFQKATFVIEDEIVLNYKDGFNTEIMARMIKEKEKELWAGRKPYLRVMDNSPIMAQDLSALHDLYFIESKKDNKEAAINNLRLLVHARQLAIHPRCRTLISHLQYGIWDERKKSFQRSGEFGHFDTIDALVYMVRNLNKTRNPIPRTVYPSSTHFIPANNTKLDASVEGFRNTMMQKVDELKDKRRS